MRATASGASACAPSPYTVSVGKATSSPHRRASAATALAGAARAQQPGRAPRAFTPADWYRVTTVSQPAVSPDGRRVAFTVTTVREAENRRHSEIWVAPLAGGEPAR